MHAASTPAPPEPTGEDIAIGTASSRSAGERGPANAQSVQTPEDASRKEVVIYAFGNVEGAIADNVPHVLQNILIVAMHVNPLLLGLVLGIKTLWDSVTDPIMAHFTDNARTRWGRRRPFILIGGVGRMLFLVAFIAFIPTSGRIAPNAVMEAQKFANEAIATASASHRGLVELSARWARAEGPEREQLREKIIALRQDAAEASLLLATHLPTLLADADKRRQAHREKQDAYAALGGDATPATRTREEGALRAAADEVATADRLLAKVRQARRELIAASFLSQHLVEPVGSAHMLQGMADEAFRDGGFESMDIFRVPEAPLPSPRERQSLWHKIDAGYAAFFDAKNADQRALVIYLLLGHLIFTTLTTVNSVPYFALGIELSPSYDGRTQVVTYRAIMNKVAGLAQPWVPVLCFSLLFVTAVQGLFWVAFFAAAIGIPSTIIMCLYTRERTHGTLAQKRNPPNMFRSIFEIARNPHFLRVFALFTFISVINGVFAQMGFYLNVYWVMGSALSGATLGAWIAMVAWGLGLLSLPLINWACRRFQKHRVLAVSILWMSFGSALKWWAVDPEHPGYQFILPLFFSVGIASVYTVLPAMLADVTDVDELRHGARREGMFGAVNAFLMKMAGALTPIVAGAVLVLAGFDPGLEYRQSEHTILWMRIMYSFLPATLMLFVLLILWRYPLTRQRVAAIKTELALRHSHAATA